MFFMSPKIICMCLIAFAIPMVTNSQNFNPDSFPELVAGRLPSARAEALGRAGVSLKGDVYSSYFNPAGLASLSGVEVAGSFAEPFYTLKDAKYSFGAVATHIPSIGTFGVSLYQLRYGTYEWQDEEVNIDPGIFGRPQASFLTLSFARNVVDVADIGVNICYHTYDWNLLSNPHESGSEFHTFIFDVGAIRSIPMATNSTTNQSLTCGARIKNLTGATLNMNPTGFPFHYPVQLNVGGTYKIEFKEATASYGLKPFEALATADYQDYLNYRYRTGFHAGIEIIGFEIVSVRIGYYSESLLVHGSRSNKSALSSATYGIGLSLPLGKLTNGKVPLRASFDYASLDQPNYSNNPMYSNFGKFSSYSLLVHCDL